MRAGVADPAIPARTDTTCKCSVFFQDSEPRQDGTGFGSASRYDFGLMSTMKLCVALAHLRKHFAQMHIPRTCRGSQWAWFFGASSVVSHTCGCSGSCLLRFWQSRSSSNACRIRVVHSLTGDARKTNSRKNITRDLGGLQWCLVVITRAFHQSNLVVMAAILRRQGEKTTETCPASASCSRFRCCVPSYTDDFV